MKKTKINQTRKEHLNEIIRCGSEPAYFIEKYVKISHPTKGSIPFKLFPYQIDCLQAFLDHNHVITNKSRQLGLSTLSAAYSLWMALFQREKNVLVIATKLSTAQLFIRKVKGMFRSLPSWLVVPNMTSETKSSLEFDNGSKIHAIPTGPDAGRGEAVSLLIVDEAAWIADFEDLWIGLQPTLSCLTANTLVFTDDGIKRIADLIPKDAIEGKITNLPHPINIFSKEGYEPATKYFVSPPSTVLRLTTKRGYSVEVTEKHPLWRLTKNIGEMTVASKMKVGDFLRLDYGQKSFAKNSEITNANVAYALGGYIAEAHEKTTPKAIWKSSSEMQSHYLGGLFDGNGSFSNKEAIFTSTSKKLIEETQILLLNKGIVSRIQFVDNEFVDNEKVKPTWNLIVTRSQLQKFADEVFLRIQKKKSIIEKTALEHNQGTEKLFSVPTSFVEAKVNEIIKRFGHSKEWFRRVHGLRFDKAFSRQNKVERTVTQQWLCKFRDILQKESFDFLEGDLRFFDNLCGSFFFDEIVKIEKLEEQKTYDFTVPKSHTFSQNGILGSNTGGDVILISSPSGVGTRFHKLWVGAMDGSNDFHGIELPWYVHPEHDQKWFDEQARAIGSQRGINSELLCKFEGSGNGFVDEEQISWLEKSVTPPLATYGPSQNVWIWKYQVPGHNYILGADVARGDGSDFSSFYVIDMDRSEVVCEFKGQLPADVFGGLIDDVGRKYNNAIVIVEQQGGGIATNLELKRLKYPRLFYDKFSKEVLMNTRPLFEQEVEPYTPGIMMSTKSRNEGLVKVEQTLRQKQLKIYSSRLLEELKTFIWHNNKAQAMKGYNDDLVMSLAITLLFFDPQSDNTSTNSSDYAKAMIAAFGTNSQTVKTFENEGDGWGQAASRNPAASGFIGLPGSDRVMNSTRTNPWINPWKNPWSWLDD